MDRNGISTIVIVVTVVAVIVVGGVAAIILLKPGAPTTPGGTTTTTTPGTTTTTTQGGTTTTTALGTTTTTTPGGEPIGIAGLPVYPDAQPAEQEVVDALTTAMAGTLPTERSIQVYKTSDDVDTVAAWYGPQMSAAGWEQTGDIPIEVAEYQITGHLLAYARENDRVVIMVVTNPQYGNGIATVKWQAPAELELPSGPELKPVGVEGTHFEVENAPFHFFGAFAFPELSDFVYAPLNLPWIYEPWRGYEETVDKYLASLVANDIHLIRFFSFGPYYARLSGRDSPDWEKLDYLVRRCEYAGIRIIWVLWDKWDYGATGAILEDYDYTADNRVLPSIVEALTRWKDSPAIFAWEIMNEGDCLNWTPEKMENYKKWFWDVSTHMKSIDPNHLISTGFSGERVSDLQVVGASADQQEFIDFYTKVHEIWAIDYISFHSYGGNPDLLTSPESYGSAWYERVGWFLDWIDNYRTTTNKPVILEEFGAQRQIGEPLRTQIYNYVIERCIQKKIDMTFNAWGADKTHQSLTIFSDDEALAALIRTTVATFNSMT